MASKTQLAIKLRQVLDHLDAEPDTVSEWVTIENSLNACAAQARQRVKLEKTIVEQRETFDKHDGKNFEPVPTQATPTARSCIPRRAATVRPTERRTGHVLIR